MRVALKYILVIEFPFVERLFKPAVRLLTSKASKNRDWPGTKWGD